MHGFKAWVLAWTVMLLAGCFGVTSTPPPPSNGANGGTNPDGSGQGGPDSSIGYSMIGRVVDDGGRAMAGVTITVSGAVARSTATDTSGNYQFVGLPNSVYSVSANYLGFTFTPIAQSITIAGANVSNVNFAATRIAPSAFLISGRVTDGSAGLGGASVNLSGPSAATTTTDSSGNYQFSVNANGTYTITVNYLNYVFSPPALSATVKDANVPDMNFVGALATYSISGRVANAAGAGLATVTVNLSGAATRSTTTDATGNYSFVGLVSGGYVVTPSSMAFTFAPSTSAVTVTTSSVANTNFTGTPVAPATYAITGRAANGSNVGLSGVSVALSGAATATTMTDGSGNYSFIGLGNGSYTLTPALTGSVFTPLSQPITISGVNVAAATFVGATTTYSMTGRVATLSGPLANVAVTLSGASSASTTTDAGGNFTFAGLQNGIYVVTPSLSGYSFSPANQAITVNNVNVTLPNFAATVLTYALAGSVTDSNSVGKSGVTLTLSGAGTGTTTSNATGNYTFANLANGRYVVTPSLAGFSFSPTNQTIDIGGGNTSALVFVATPVTYTLSGRVTTATGGAIANVSVALSGAQSATLSTNSTGDYSFTGLQNGSYTVTPALAGYTFSPATQAAVINGSNVTSNFTATPITYTISGQVTSAGVAKSGVTLTLSGAGTGSMTSDASGNYSFTNLGNGTYVVTPALAGFSFSPPSQSIVVNGASVAALAFVATPITYTISGQVVTSAGVAKSGVTVTLSGAGTGSVVSDINGAYAFSTLSNGSYTVTPSLAGFTFAPSSQTLSVSGANVSALAFIATATVTTFSISGHVVTSTGANLSGVTLTLSGAATGSAASDASGNFSFATLANGAYTVTPTLVGYTFTPTNQAVTINGASISTVNFTATAATYSVSGTVTNAGVAVGGVTLALSGAGSANTSTSASGVFTFTSLVNGSYLITPSLTGYTFTPASQSITVSGSNVTGISFNATPIVSSGTRNYTLYITSGTLTVNDKNGAAFASLMAWSYTDVAGTAKFPAPVLTANEGDTVTVTVVNNHTVAHNFYIQGVTNDTASIAAGASKMYSFTASAAGTYLYYDTLNSPINREMGMYGAFVVAPAGGAATVWTGGPAYSFQRTWVLGEMDKGRWNDVAGAGGAVTTSVYKPNYFLINGKGGFDGMKDVSTTIDGGIGQTALVRIVNGGQFNDALHFHGNHIKVVTVNGVHQAMPYKEVDVLIVPPLQTMEVLYDLSQLGEYPMHNHTAQMETANGVYLNGIATMIVVH